MVLKSAGISTRFSIRSSDFIGQPVQIDLMLNACMRDSELKGNLLKIVYVGC